MSTTWTTDDLANIESAIAKGVLKVKMSDGKEVTYDSLGELIKRRDLIRIELGIISPRPRRKRARFSKDL